MYAYYYHNIPAEPSKTHSKVASPLTCTVLSCHVMLCHVFHVKLCLVKSCNVVSCHEMLWHVAYEGTTVRVFLMHYNSCTLY